MRPPRFGRAEFDEWYLVHAPPGLPPEKLTEDDTGPESGPAATDFQKIAGRIGVVRDRAITAAIFRALDAYPVVAVVYGGSHLLTEEPALRARLGIPIYRKPF